MFYLVCGLGAALIHLLFLSYELMPLVKDYTAITQGGSGYNSDAMIQFLLKYHIRFDEVTTSSLIDEIQKNPTDPGIGHLFRELTLYYENRLNTSTIGASGAVFGVLAAFVYLFPNTYLYIYFLVPVKAKWIGLLYFGYELFYALRNSAGDNVARWAHVGGAIVGFIIVMTWNKTNKKTFY
jgi:membrane associated rhomboid family serine protease